jgi:hypothetical protein
MLEAAVAEIKPNAHEPWKVPARSEKLNVSEKDRAFALSMYLLAAKPYCVKLADAFRIPVPFGVLLAEELDHIDQSRAKRDDLSAPLSEHGVLPYA